jgi:uncharacterized RDD family membrane protein YckC
MSDCTLIDRLRKPKIFEMSIFDWITSFIGAYYIGIWFFGMKNETPNKWVCFLFIWTLFGIFVHKLLNIDTQLGYYLGINKKPIRKDC